MLENLNFSDDPALRTREAAKYLGIKSLTTFYQHIKNGSLPQGALIGRARVWRRSTLNTFLDIAFSKPDDSKAESEHV